MTIEYERAMRRISRRRIRLEVERRRAEQAKTPAPKSQQNPKTQQHPTTQPKPKPTRRDARS